MELVVVSTMMAGALLDSALAVFDHIFGRISRQLPLGLALLEVFRDIKCLNGGWQRSPQ